MIGKTIIIGDIHGCLEEFNKLLNLVNYKSSDDTVILLGDLIDRGPDSIGVLRKARENKMISILGNHEFKFLRNLRNGTKDSDFKIIDKMQSDDIAYIKNMVPFFKTKNTIMVHGGLFPGFSLENQDLKSLCTLRYLNNKKEIVYLKDIKKHGKKKLNAHYWTEFWEGPESVIYGHEVHSYNDPLIEQPLPGVFCYGIDTGVVFGGHLSCLILETKEILQVKKG